MRKTTNADKEYGRSSDIDRIVGPKLVVYAIYKGRKYLVCICHSDQSTKYRIDDWKSIWRVAFVKKLGELFDQEQLSYEEIYTNF